MTRYLVKGWKVITLESTSPVVNKGALIVSGDSIEAVGHEEELKTKGPFDFEIGSDDFIVMPGLVNAHYHAGNKMRTGHQDGPLETWLPAVRTGLNAGTSAIAYENTQYYACEMVRAGITCCVDNIPIKLTEPDYDYGVTDVVRAYIDLGMRIAIAPMGQNKSAYVYDNDDDFLSTVPLEIAEQARRSRFGFLNLDEDKYLSVMKKVFQEYHGAADDMVRVLLCPYGEGWCTDSMLMKIKQVAREWKTGIHMHLLETRYQMLRAIRANGTTAVDHLCRIGFLGEDVSCAHVIWLTSEDIEKFTDCGAIAVYNPGSNLRLGSGVARIRDLIEQNGRLAIGTDAMSVGDANDLLGDLRVGALLQRLPGIQSSWIDATTWLKAVTKGSAEVAGFGNHCGVLSVGRKADLILIDRKRISRPYIHESLPITDVILHFANGIDVDTVIINGKLIMKEKRILTIDEQKLTEKMRNNYEAIREQIDVPTANANKNLKTYIEKWCSDLDKKELDAGYRYNTK